MHDAISNFQDLLENTKLGNRRQRRASVAILRKEITRIRKFVAKYIVAWGESMQCFRK
jgi:hypothetical protein